MDQEGKDAQPIEAAPSAKPIAKETESMAKQTELEMAAGEGNPFGLPGMNFYEGASKWLSMGRANAEALMQSSQAAMKGMMAANEAVWKFSEVRLQKNLELGKTMMGSRDIAENLRIQAEHGQGALEDCFQLANEMVDIARRATQESWEVLENRANANVVEIEKAA